MNEFETELDSKLLYMSNDFGEASKTVEDIVFSFFVGW